MNKHTHIWFWALPVVLLTACSGDVPEQSDPLATAPELEEELMTPALELDSSPLQPLADSLRAHGGSLQTLALPAERLRTHAFRPVFTAERFVQTAEPFTRVRSLGATEEFESASWRMESGAGRLFVLRKPNAAPGAAVATDEISLRDSARTRLRSWGVPDEEVGDVWQRQVLGQERVAGVNMEPQLYAHKTFVIRAIQGVPVQGHRAVITHAPDGTFTRAMVNWPALAASGHTLRTPLDVPAIEGRTRAAFAKEGGTPGKARLRWKYVPEELPSGEVRLKLMVGARAPMAMEDGMSEPRELDIDVDAVP